MKTLSSILVRMRLPEDGDSSLHCPAFGDGFIKNDLAMGKRIPRVAVLSIGMTGVSGVTGEGSSEVSM